MDYKICTKCKQEKSINNFCKHKGSKDGLQSNCRQCASVSSKKWKENNLEKSKLSHKISYKKNKIYKEKIPFDIRKQQLKEYQNEWMKNKRKDPLVKLNNSVMHSIWKSLTKNNIKKTNRTLEILGLENWDKFKNYIESQFTEGMNWNNYGKTRDCWSIDHIIPKSKASTLEEIKKLNHYTNLRPMWHIENIKKSNK